MGQDVEVASGGRGGHFAETGSDYGENPMELKKAKVREFRSVWDSGPIEFGDEEA